MLIKELTEKQTQSNTLLESKSNKYKEAKAASKGLREEIARLQQEAQRLQQGLAQSELRAKEMGERASKLEKQKQKYKEALEQMNKKVD